MSPKRWAAITAEKLGPCRICCDPGRNGSEFGLIQLHHVVARDHFGDDVAENIVPVCTDCHALLHYGSSEWRAWAARGLLASLTDAEYAYMIERGGENYPERAYGLRYTR